MNHTDHTAEATLLAHAIHNGRNAQVHLRLPVDAFTHPLHRILFGVIGDTVTAGRELDPATLSLDLVRACKTAGLGFRIEDCRKLILDLITDPAAVGSGSIPYLQSRLLTLLQIRLAYTAATRMVQRIDESARNADLSDLSALLDDTKADLNIAAASGPRSILGAGGDLPQSIAELLEVTVDYDWIIPKLLERGDRLILTGEEGLGKSHFLAQMACAIASGFHPFLGTPVMSEGKRWGPPNRKVLVIDAESSVLQCQRRYREMTGTMSWLTRRAGLQPPDWTHTLRMHLEPRGIALNRADHHSLIESKIAAFRPDVVCMGPLYRLTTLDIEAADGAHQLIEILDRLRVDYEFTLILEAHSPHGDGAGRRPIRPIGSSQFRRWPEFGYGLVAGDDNTPPQSVKVLGWRGARDQDRLFPRVLHRSEAGGLPLQPDQGYKVLCHRMGVGPVPPEAPTSGDSGSDRHEPRSGPAHAR